MHPNTRSLRFRPLGRNRRRTSRLARAAQRLFVSRAKQLLLLTLSAFGVLVPVALAAVPVPARFHPVRSTSRWPAAFEYSP